MQDKAPLSFEEAGLFRFILKGPETAPGIFPKACSRQVDKLVSKAVADPLIASPPFSTEGFYVLHQSPRRFTFASAVYLAQWQADGDQPAQSQ
jgi:hypothetical protein